MNKLAQTHFCHSLLTPQYHNRNIETLTLWSSNLYGQNKQKPTFIDFQPFDSLLTSFLRFLSVIGGSLSHVPHFLNPDTEILDVSGNQIVKLESGLTYYPDLLTVNMSSNSFRSLGR